MQIIEMTEFEVGKENPMKKPEMEGAICEMGSSGLSLHIYCKNPTQEELRCLTGDFPMKSGILNYYGLLFLIFSFPGIAIYECPFNSNLYQEKVWSVLRATKLEDRKVHLFLTDWNTNIICAKRTLELESEFWYYFFENADKQIEIGLTAEQTEALLEQAYYEYALRPMLKDAQLFS